MVTIFADMEVMARTFLEAMDRVIAPFAGNNVIPPPALAKILSAKETLVEAIPVGIVNIVGKEVEPDLAHVAAKAMERALWKSLAHGFNSAAIVIERETHDTTLHYAGVEESTVPLAVRFVPSPVELRDQSVVTTYPEAETAAEASLCKYSLSWYYEGIATDAIWIRLAEAEPSYKTAYLDDKLFCALAQFRIVDAALSADIPAVYTSADAGNKVVLAAYNAFAEIAENVAAAWSDFVAPVLPSPIRGKGPFYALRFNHIAGCLHSVTLNIINAASQKTELPALFSKNINGKYEQLVMTATGDDVYTYMYEGGDESDGCSMLAEFVCEDIFGSQPFFETIVARNWTEQLNTDLVYTAMAGFAKPLNVHIVQTERFVIDTTVQPAAEAVVDFFRSLLSTAKVPPTLQIGLAYTYPLSPEPGVPWASLPVSLIPPTTYSDELIVGMLASAHQWRESTQPPATGCFTMKVTVYGAAMTPVLELDEVTFDC
jgi:hypothetical protein